MVDDGVHPRVIQHRLGHATAKLSQELYAHVSDPADQDAAARLGAGFRTLRARSGHGTDPTTDQRPFPGTKVQVKAVEVTGLEPATSTLRT